MGGCCCVQAYRRPRPERVQRAGPVGRGGAFVDEDGDCHPYSVALTLVDLEPLVSAVPHEPVPERWWTAGPPPRRGLRSQAATCPLEEPLPFELRERRQAVPLEPPDGVRRVELLVPRDELHAEIVELAQRRGERPQASAEAVKSRNHDHVDLASAS
jgi:hypothetical protein